MSYRVRFTLPNGQTGHWMRNYATREEAQKAIDDRHGDTGLAYYVEEVTDAPEPTSTTERLVSLLRDRHARGLAEYGTTLDRTDLSPEDWAQHAIEEALDLAGYLMRVKDSLAASRQGTAKASEAPREGGDSDRRRLEAIERFLDGDTFRQIWKTTQGNIVAGTTIEGQEYAAPTLAALADKLAEMGGKP